MQFIDTTGFTTSSLSNVVNNLVNRIHKIKYKYRQDDKKHEAFRIRNEYCDCFLEYTNLKDDLIEYKYSFCKKNHLRKFDENLRKRLFNTYKYSNHDINKFILLLQKGVYPCENLDVWEN